MLNRRKRSEQRRPFSSFSSFPFVRLCLQPVRLLLCYRLFIFLLLAEYRADRLAVGDADRPALFGDIFLLRIDTDRGGERGEDVGNVHFAFDDFVAAVAGLAVGLAALDSATREDACPGGRKMIAAALRIDRGCAAELADPED